MERDDGDELFFEFVLLAAAGYYDRPTNYNSTDVPRPQPAPVIVNDNVNDNQLPRFQAGP